MGETVFYEHVAVEPAHFGHGKHAYRAERVRPDGQNLALSDIRKQAVVRRGLQSVEGYIARSYVALQRAESHLFGERARHYLLVAHYGIYEPFRAGIAAVKAHEGIRQLIVEFALYPLSVQFLGKGIVYVQQGDAFARHAGADIFGQGAVYVDLAGDGQAHSRKARIYIAGHEAELRLECRPAFACDCHIFSAALVRRRPVQNGQLVPGKPGEYIGAAVACAELLRHIIYDGGNAAVALMLVEALE